MTTCIRAARSWSSAAAILIAATQVAAADPEAFVYTQELAGLRGGYVYGVKSKL